MSETGWGFGVDGYTLEYTINFEEDECIFVLLDVRVRNNETMRIGLVERWNVLGYNWRGRVISYIDKKIE